MDYILKEFRWALIAYIVICGIIAWINPFASEAPFLVSWVGSVIVSCIIFFIWVFIRAAFLSFIRRKRS